MTAICPEYLAEGLERVFKRIHSERMQGLPVLNPALEVEAVGFRGHDDGCLGVLITPWFMNLMLLPGEGDDWRGIPAGSVQVHRFPSGTYEFIVGEETEIGHYQLCSLFSPVFEFADQAAAVATAEAALDALLDAAAVTADSGREREGDAVTGRLRGATAATTEHPGLQQRLQQPVSRRALLRGMFFGGS